ncbi:MAG: glycosyltransferase family 39 protein [Chloroflexi bacterium]|nr:glycosyltransferase family 39 protein [Chloroflexota bacterium]
MRTNIIEARSQRLLWLIVLGYLALSLTYSVAIPLFEGPDENHHFFVIKHLADGKGFVQVDPANLDSSWTHGLHPPLYYILSAAIMRFVDTSDAEVIYWENPIGNKGAAGNTELPANTVFHTQRENFPWQSTTLAIHLIRMLSTALGGLTIILTYATAKLIFEDENLALASAAVNAFLPQFLFIHSLVTNDALATFLSSVGVWLALRLIKGKSEANIKKWLLLGFIVGCAALTKYAGLVLLPFILSAIIVTSLIRKWTFSKLVVAVSVVTVVAAGIAGGWYLRNFMLYGNFLASNIFAQIVDKRSSPDVSSILFNLQGIQSSFWAVFGWHSILVDLWFYRYTEVITLVAVVGLVTIPFRRFARRNIILFLMIGAWLLLTTIALLQWTIMVASSSQGRLLFPAISSIIVLLVWGWRLLLPRKFAIIGMWCFIAPLIIQAAMSPWFYIQPAYVTGFVMPPQERVNQISSDQIVEPINAHFKNIGALLKLKIQPPVVRRGEVLRITMFWKAEGRPIENYHVFVHLIHNTDDDLLTSHDGPAANGAYPTTVWSPGELITGEHLLPIPSNAKPGDYRLQVGMYRFPSVSRLPVFDEGGSQMTEDAIQVRTIVIIK